MPKDALTQDGRFISDGLIAHAAIEAAARKYLRTYDGTEEITKFLNDSDPLMRGKAEAALNAANDVLSRYTDEKLEKELERSENRYKHLNFAKPDVSKESILANEAFNAAMGASKRTNIDNIGATVHIENTKPLEPGYYRVNADDEFELVGPAEPMVRYHGTARRGGKIISEFRPHVSTSGDVDSRDMPAIYAAKGVNDALLYAAGYGRNPLRSNVESQLYTLTITPNVIVDLGDCDDRNVFDDAIGRGADVIECPDFWEHPETVIFNPETIKIEKVERMERKSRHIDAYHKDDFSDLLGPPQPIDTEQRLKLGKNRRVIKELAPALELTNNEIDSVKESMSPSSTTDTDKSMEYRGITKEPTYQPRSGRGRIR